MDPNEKENTQLPSVLSISKFSVARGKEIQTLNQALKSSTGVKLAFQKLPKHMRRRAMSHNVKRLPRRLREIHLHQMTKSGLPPKQKRPSRKYRRRPSNLTSEYQRRQKKCCWLNTHIWHAKRFHMIEKWGYKLPHRPCDRSFRACYRATTKHCLLQDISYYNCLEINGEDNNIIHTLKAITDSTVDKSMFIKSLLSGLREGQFTLTNPDTQKSVGIVYFLWRPNLSETRRALWIWVHAAFFNEALQILSKFSNNIELKNLKFDVSRFRLTGPLSNVVLFNAFKLMDKLMCIETNIWTKLFLAKVDDEYLINMSKWWVSLKSMSSPAEMSPHFVIPLIIQDPRLNLPKKRTKAWLQYYSDDTMGVSSWHNVLENPLWNEENRKCSEKSKPSQAYLASLNEKLLVPGSASGEIPTLLPVTIVQRPGRRSKEYNGYGAGWDIIFPSAWAQPIWLSLIMWGARSGGLKEMDSINFESDQQYYLYPDTNSGKTEEYNLSCKLKDDFFKLPPNKRPNYIKFGIKSPFSWNWQLLLKEWGCTDDAASNFVVLRNKDLLYKLQDIISKKEQLETEMEDNILVPVSLKFNQKGSSRKLAVICLPIGEDFKETPVEPCHKDVNEDKRKSLRNEHKDLLKRLRRKRRRVRKNNGEKIPIDLDVLKNYSQQMRQLWVPETTAIRCACSREIMGFVSHGDFSFLLAKTKAIGYVTIGGLKKLIMEGHGNHVLVRNTNSRIYRLAKLDVIQSY